MVDLVGIEPTTSSMPWKRAPNCATGPHWYNPIFSGLGRIVKRKPLPGVQPEKKVRKMELFAIIFVSQREPYYTLGSTL